MIANHALPWIIKPLSRSLWITYQDVEEVSQMIASVHDTFAASVTKQLGQNLRASIARGRSELRLEGRVGQARLSALFQVGEEILGRARGQHRSPRLPMPRKIIRP